MVRPLTEVDILNRTYLMTVLKTNRSKVEPATAILLFNIIDSTPRHPVALAFEKPLYRGSINKNGYVIMEDVVLVASTYNSAATFELSGVDSEFFELTAKSNVVLIGLRKSGAHYQMADREYFTFEVVARHPEASLARALVLISVPTKKCQG